jgi:hypothetical protein
MKMKDDQIFQQKQAQPSPTSTNVNESQPPSHAAETPLGDVKQSPSQELAKVERMDQLTVHKSTGPRTTQGKNQSKLNALKHGLLSKVILLKGESPTEFHSLLNELLDDWQPQGKSETLCVENLAAEWWLKRRYYQAKNAIIAEKIEFVQRDFDAKRRDEASEGSRTAIANGGLLRNLANPYLIREAKELLSELRRNVVARIGENLSGLLMQLYGKDQVGVIPHLLLPQSGTPVDQSVIVASMIEDEIKRLTKLEKDLMADDTLRIQYRKSAAVIPSQDVLDRLMRYETHFSREIDRILNRLESLQRRRKGQPPTPPVER